jgi:hypothetical protein
MLNTSVQLVTFGTPAAAAALLAEGVPAREVVRLTPGLGVFAAEADGVAVPAGLTGGLTAPVGLTAGLVATGRGAAPVGPAFGGLASGGAVG